MLCFQSDKVGEFDGVSYVLDGCDGADSEIGAVHDDGVEFNLEGGEGNEFENLKRKRIKKNTKKNK